MAVSNNKKDLHPKFALVVFPLPLFQAFAYRIPAELQQQVSTGSVVSAPFRRWVKTGFVTGFSDKPPPGEVKELQDLLMNTPVFTKELLELAKWMSSYYFTAPGEIFHTMLPVKLNRDSIELISLSDSGKSIDKEQWESIKQEEKKLIEYIKSRERVTPQSLKQEFGYYQIYYKIDRLKRQGFINIEQIISEKRPKPKTQLLYNPLIILSAKKQDEVFGRAHAQREVYNYILEHAPVWRTAVLKQFSGRDTCLTALVEKNVIEKVSMEVTREYDSDVLSGREELPSLTADQQNVVAAVYSAGSKKRFATFLLHGITGSGKTRVYFELIHNALSRNESVLFLVPEISLTDYFLASLRRHFADSVTVLHSRMSEGERYDSWRGILSGKKRLVIGPRSAVFAPVHDLGLIIVDEEHDTSYKQHESPPYYHARDVAVYRARLTGSRIILGSATPSMESYFNAQSGKYRLLELPERIDRTPLPKVALIDMREKRKKHGLSYDRIFSAELLSELETRLKLDEQVLLMLNRRGYSTFVQCSDCGYIETCPHCMITLTFHKAQKTVRCHFCGYSNRAPSECPECRGTAIRYSGIGTQQVEEALQHLVPGYRAIRMDQDTTRSKSSHRKITSQFERGESDILVGTQMIAKGFDFARVNLVGVISADTGLLLPEFRAAEKTFQLMTQAAGRAGRRKERGIVIIQTYMPDHYSLKTAQDHDFHQFYTIESKYRRELNYPPHGRIILLRFFSEDNNRAANAAIEVGKKLIKSHYRRYMLGPAPAPIEKIRKMYRWHLFLKSGKTEDKNGRKIRTAAHIALDHFEKSGNKKHVILTIDVDPVSLL